jgi:hypothetical protein
MTSLRVEHFPIPGTSQTLVYERHQDGRLARLSLLEANSSGRVYYRDAGGERIIGDDLARFAEVRLPNGFLRKAHAAGQVWVEEYLWDAGGRLRKVDGVEIERDERQRVILCAGPVGEWHYHYSGEHLIAVQSPQGEHAIEHGMLGRPEAIRRDSSWQAFTYDSQGTRMVSARLPANYLTDALGRLWTVTGIDGRVQTTYLWDGFACLGRIDGPPGDPLAAAFSLDPSNTPVRVITRESVHRLPRDAFGELLLDYEGVPGLFGGTVYDGLVHFQARSLDPASGAFTSPDPWHGRRDDPRRSNGYSGSLAVERAPAGPYAVCQHDPVGRADPTGTNSVLLVLSDLTWSYQNNITSIFGLDLWFNFLTSLFGSLSGTNFIGDFFNCGGFSSTDREGAFGLRRDGAVKAMIPNPAFTFQHLVYTTDAFLQQLRQVRVFAPDPFSDFAPSYYGTFLRLVPDSGDPLLLQGDRNICTLNNATGLSTWSRAGGAARAAIPGSLTPVFPTGGLHLDSPSTLLTPLGGELQELEPDGDVLVGTFDQQDTLLVSGSFSGLSVGSLALVTDASGAGMIVQLDSIVSVGTNTGLEIRSAISFNFAGILRLRGLGAGSPVENGLSLVAGGPDRLNLASIAASAAPYTTNDALRLSQGGLEVGSATVSSFEAQLQIDAALPSGASGLVKPLAVHIANLQGAGNPRPTVVSDTVLEFPSAPPPVGKDEPILVGNAPNQVAVVITNVNGAQITLDRSISAAGAVGSRVAWRRLGRGDKLGQRNADVEAANQVTYAADAIRRAPTSGLVWVEDSSSPTRLAVRSVTGRAYDSLVLGAPAPGNQATPYNVERFPIQAPDVGGVVGSTIRVLTLPAPLSSQAVALHYNLLVDPVLTAGPTVVLNGSVVNNILSTTQAPFAANTTRRPMPSEVVVLRQGTNLAAALVKEMRVTVTFERNLPLVNTKDLEAVELQDASPTYTAVRNGGREVTVLPDVAGTRVQMPRFAAKQLVRLAFTGAGRAYRHFRVAKVDGTTLTLDGDDDLPDPAPNLTITRLDVSDPGTGGARLAIAGTRDPATPNQVNFQVWDRAAFWRSRLVAIVDGENSLPAQVDAGVTVPPITQAVQIIFAANPSLSGANVDLTEPALGAIGSIYNGQFTTQQNKIITLGIGLPVVMAGEGLAAVVPYRKKGDGVRGSFSSGTTLIPQDLENYELDRYDALEEHELRHTLQSAYSGPWLLAWFPLFGLEGILEATTGIELPEYSAYVSAHLEKRRGGMVLVLENPPDDVNFEAGDWVQIASRGEHKPARLEPGPATNEFRLRERDDLPDCPVGETCPVFVRKDNHNAWRTFYDTLYFTTTGGLLNTAFGFTYGDGLVGLIKLFYALGNVFTGPGKRYPATLQDGGWGLKVTDPAVLTVLSGATRLIIQQGDNILVRVKESVVGDVIRLTAGTNLTGNVEVSPYDTHTPGSYFDWHHYYPATVPEPSQPATIQLEDANGDSLTLEPFDVVTVTARDQSRRTNVMTVSGNLVQLEDIPPMDIDRSLRVAKISESDPLGDVDTYQFRRLGLNWLRWIFDPYRQFQYALDPESGKFWDILARIGRYLFSSKSWSVLPPFFGLWWWDNVFKQGAPHFSWMEQDASENSGDLYSSLGRLRGDVAFVGDIARYWFFISGRSGGLIDGDEQDMLTPRYNDFPRVIPSLDTGGASTDEPNRGGQINPAVTDPGLDVPDIFYTKSLTTPNARVETGPDGFRPSARGFVPTSAKLEDAMGMYVAFSRPGSHRATVVNNNGLKNSREVQTEGMSILGIGLGHQPLYFDITVQDVSVTIAGQDVPTPAAGDPLPRLQLVLTQRAVIEVSPNQSRRYVVTVPNPSNGTVLRAPGDLELQAGLQAGNDQPVEISRVHRFRDGAFEGSGLQTHGLHLPGDPDGDVHVPVRLLVVDVVNTLPVRAAVALDPAQVITEIRAGSQAFVIVPAATLAPLSLAQVTYPGGVIPGITNPVPGITPLSNLSDDQRKFTGDGAVFQIDFLANDPPEESANLEFRVQVGSGGNSATLTATLSYLPHFRLALPGGGTNYQVSRNGQLALDLTDAVQPGTVSISPEDGASVAVQGSQVIVSTTPTAALGPRQVRVSDADPSNANHFARRTVTVV